LAAAPVLSAERAASRRAGSFQASVDQGRSSASVRYALHDSEADAEQATWAASYNRKEKNLHRTGQYYSLA
jgi:hypothetical protein